MPRFWPGHIEEEDFLQKYGKYTLGRFGNEFGQHRSEYNNWVETYDLDETVENYVKKFSKGYAYFSAFSDYDQVDLYNIVIKRKREELRKIYTKPGGLSASWLEIGIWHDKYGWKKDSLRYPQKDDRLWAKRTFHVMPEENGKVNEDYIEWSIDVALDYPLAIRLVSRGPVCKREPYDGVFIDTTARMIWVPKQ